MQTPKYCEVARYYQFGSGNTVGYRGPVVASADAFYLVPYVAIDSSAGLGMLGGALGGALIAANSNPLVAGDENLEDLPANITGHTDWPVRRTEGPVLIVPRESIRMIQYSFWGTFDLLVPPDRIRIALKLFSRKRVTNYLRAQGWKF